MMLSGAGCFAPTLKHFAAEWKYLTPHKCDENKWIEHVAD